MTRRAYVVLAALGVVATTVTTVIATPPRLLWNASASVPIGLYSVRPAGVPEVGELVAVAPPRPLAAWLAARGYLPAGVPLIKRVAAMAHQRVCRTGTRIIVSGRTIGVARSRDSRGRVLPVWRGCRTLRDGELFLMNAAVPDSLDGRYFGPVPVRTLIGHVSPILTRDTPDAPLVWRSR